MRAAAIAVTLALLPGSGAPSDGSLAARLRSAAPQDGWAGWAVPGLPGVRLCSSWCKTGASCRLDGDDQVISNDGAAASGGEPLRIYARLREGRALRLQLFSQSCPLDTQGTAVAWLEGVTADESLAFLAALVQQRKPESSPGQTALVALAHHAGPGADAWLDRFSERGQPAELRRDAVFWLGHLRGRHGFEKARALVGDPDPELREQAVFALSQNPLPEARQELFRLARGGADPGVRARALFWLGQRAGEKAAPALADAVDDDPDVEVKEQAVFALSQLPADEGVPQLIRLARTHRVPQVRKAALFWLGESGDPRALALFEEILLR